MTQWASAWGPSLKVVVAIDWEAETPVSQGRIWVPSHSPPIIALAQSYSVSATRLPSSVVSP